MYSPWQSTADYFQRQTFPAWRLERFVGNRLPLVSVSRHAKCVWRGEEPTLNGNLHYPNDIDRSLHEAAADKIRKYRIALTIITASLMLSPLCQLLLVRLGGCIVNLCAFYDYKLIGKLTAFLQLQEFSLRNQTVDSSTSAARPSPRTLKRK